MIVAPWPAKTTSRSRAGRPRSTSSPSTTCKAAAERAFTARPQGRLLVRHGRRATGRWSSWIAERHGLPKEQVIATNGSMQADAFLFQHLVGRRRPVVIEAPTYDRTLLSLAEAGRRPARHPARGRRPGRAGARARRWRRAPGPSSPTSSPTSTTPPAARSRSTSAAGWSSWPPSTTSSSSRTTPTWSCASRASRCPRCCRWTSPTTWSTRRRSRRRSARASASATWPGPEG